ncbi:MAG: hypothetical protein JSW39_22525 [Desulfobacterales bacterium]|nr:MAG: hypothetical protein JSW39_22525 [Desulfobacterales bacterium]
MPTDRIVGNQPSTAVRSGVNHRIIAVCVRTGIIPTSASRWIRAPAAGGDSLKGEGVDIRY